MKTALPLLFLFLVNVLSGQTASPVQVKNELRVYLLDGHTYLFVDTTEALTFEEVRQESFQRKFQPLDTPYVRQQPDRAYWLKTQITATDTLTDWLLLLKNPVYKKYETVS